MTLYKNDSKKLTEHFFRNEYGKLVAVITQYIGSKNVETAEDIVQETLLKAVDHWQHSGIPKNPQAWLYTTAKNLTLNSINRKKHESNYLLNTLKKEHQLNPIEFSENLIMDGQLNMMFACCHPSISENSQIALILKILCGFSISEIANSFFTTNETINKRLVRGRKQLRKSNFDIRIIQNINDNVKIVLKTIYLLFNEGYYPSKKTTPFQYDLCLEAIRLTKLVIKSDHIKSKAECHALLALMYLNCSRFEARLDTADQTTIELPKQDRSLWNQDLIQLGIQQLQLATDENSVSKYLILATISAQHCIAKTYETTDWNSIVSLYDQLLSIENSPIIHLNKSVALSKTKGNKEAITQLLHLKTNSDIENHYLFHATLGELFKNEKQFKKAKSAYLKAINLTKNSRNIILLNKKINDLVPISKTQLL